MSKLDELRKATGSNVVESMGKGVIRSPVPHGASPPSAGPDRWAGVERLTGAQRIPVARIERDPSQPREVFDEPELAELTESIRARGILQPIRVRWVEGRGMYVVIAGERRLRAATAAGLVDVPCVVQDAPLSDAEILLDQLAENMIRLDLQPIEQARAFKRLMDSQGWSARRLAEALHIDHDKVNRAVRLLELPERVQDAVADGELAPTTAFELSKLDDPAEQESIAARVVAEGLSRTEAAEAVRRAEGRPKGRGRKGRGTGVRKITSRTFRLPDSYKITVERAKGIEPAAIAKALRTAATQIEAELGPQGTRSPFEAA